MKCSQCGKEFDPAVERSSFTNKYGINYDNMKFAKKGICMECSDRNAFAVAKESLKRKFK